jgi:trigger factor
MSKEKRPPIPDSMKRVIRQRCGFGCVVCGFPLYEFEHMEDWALTKTHDPSNITLLCDKHHKEKTNGLLPLEHVRKANEKPWTKQKGHSTPYDLHFEGPTCEILMGTNVFGITRESQQFVALMIDGVPLLGFVYEDQNLQVTLHMFNKCNEGVLAIFRNELVYSTEPWDIELVGRNLVVRYGKGEIFVDLLFDPPRRVVVQRGRFLLNGVEVGVDRKCVSVRNNGARITGSEWSGGFVCIALGTAPPLLRAALRMESIDRYTNLRNPERSASTARPDGKRGNRRDKA